jgi:hypothetical protein
MIGGGGGQPPFDHRKIPESPDDIESIDSHIGCLVLLVVVIGISVLLFLLRVAI